jgi:hypothetical protein
MMTKQLHRPCSVRTNSFLTVIFLSIILLVPGVSAFVITSSTKNRGLYRVYLLKAVSSENNDPESNNNSGYKFGDITRGALKRFQGRVNSLTGKPSYEFGDLSKWMDSKAKERVAEFTSRKDYQFGDISKEVVRRLVQGEYSRDDLMLFLKIVATIGINLQPVAKVLPVRVLMELLDLTLEASIAQTVVDKVVGALTTEIDGRMKEIVTGDRNYQLGDLTKRAIAKWSKNDEDLSASATRADRTYDKKTKAEKSAATDSFFELDKEEQKKIEEWDREFLEFHRETNGLTTLNDDESYRDWDERYLSSQQGSFKNNYGNSE